MRQHGPTAVTDSFQPAARQDANETSRWPVILMTGLLAAGILSVLAWLIEIPYVAFGPGPVSDAADSVVAADVETYPPDGELLMLTVVSQDVNLFEAAIAGLDPTIELVEKQALRREGETDEQYRNRVLTQMDDSHFRSIAVALDFLDIAMIPTRVVIKEFVEGAPAAEVLELGDGIVSINGVEIGELADVGATLDGAKPGDVVLVGVDRGGKMVEVEVALAEREDEPGVPMIGVLLGELTEPPFPLSIEAGDVGGPSAGMMHTLAIIDTLTEGEMTKGHVIAGTGTIRSDGAVGAIGGVRQKIVAAEAAGASHVLVPADNYERALTAERDDIEIVPVSDLQDAVDFFDSLQAA